MIEIQVPELLQSLPENLSDVIKPWAERFPDRMALVETSGSWTYGQLDAVVKQTRAWLRDSGCAPRRSGIAGVRELSGVHCDFAGLDWDGCMAGARKRAAFSSRD